MRQTPIVNREWCALAYRRSHQWSPSECNLIFAITWILIAVWHMNEFIVLKYIDVTLFYSLCSLFVSRVCFVWGRLTNRSQINSLLGITSKTDKCINNWNDWNWFEIYVLRWECFIGSSINFFSPVLFIAIAMHLIVVLELLSLFSACDYSDFDRQRDRHILCL